MRLIDGDELLKKLVFNPSDMFTDRIREIVKEAPIVEAIPKGAYEQVKWERDMAAQQLNDYGVQLGEKADLQAVVRCKDCKWFFESDSYWADHCRRDGKYRDRYDYCSRGERGGGDCS
jgi:hypothetical protein